MKMTELDIPKTVCFIPDGNRRGAKTLGLSLTDAYVRGGEVFIQMVEHALTHGIKNIIAFGSSRDNVKKRPLEEVQAMHNGAVMVCKRLAANPLINIRLFGNVNGIKVEHRKQELLPYKHFRSTGKLTVYIGLNYSPRDNASVKVPGVNLMIRTGGVYRLSNFIPTELGNADTKYHRKMWLTFNKRDFDRALVWYSQQEHRDGK